MSTQNDYLSMPLRDFLSALAARSPMPGSGSVAALLGALSAAQARMVIEYSMGKPPHDQHDDRFRKLMDELVKAEESFGQLMHEDEKAYQRFQDTRKEGKGHEVQVALGQAIAVPLEIIVLARAVATRLDEIKSAINPYLLSELQVAAILTYSAARAACTAVRCNLNQLADNRERERLDNQLDQLVGSTARHRNGVVHYQPG